MGDIAKALDDALTGALLPGWTLWELWWDQETHRPTYRLVKEVTP